MKFEEYLALHPKVAAQELPGTDAQLEMAPQSRSALIRKLKHDVADSRLAAVMMVVYPDASGDARFICILRKTYRGVHSDQIGFPGGKQDLVDDSLLETAYREVEEEIALSRKRIHAPIPFTPLYVPPSNFTMHAFLAYVTTLPQLIPEEREVEAILDFSIADLLDDQNCVTKRITTNYLDDYKTPVFELEGKTIWGATAMILAEVRAAIRKAL